MNLAPAEIQLLDSAILALWRRRFNTVEIAKRLNREEALVANRLARLRDGSKPEVMQ